MGRKMKVMGKIILSNTFLELLTNPRVRLTESKVVTLDIPTLSP